MVKIEETPVYIGDSVSEDSPKKEDEDVNTNTFFQRMNICGTCEHMKRGLKISRCQLCGCILAVKARLKGEKCPIGKW